MTWAHVISAVVVVGIGVVSAFFAYRQSQQNGYNSGGYSDQNYERASSNNDWGTPKRSQEEGELNCFFCVKDLARKNIERSRCKDVIYHSECYVSYLIRTNSRPLCPKCEMPM